MSSYGPPPADRPGPPAGGPPAGGPPGPPPSQPPPYPGQPGQPAQQGPQTFPPLSSPPPQGQPPAYSPNPYTQNPYAQNPYADSPYGQPAYAQNPYAQAHPQPAYGGYPQPAYGAPYAAPAGEFVPWGRRAGAFVVDYLLSVAAALPLGIGYVVFQQTFQWVRDTSGNTVSLTPPHPVSYVLFGLGLLTSIVFWVWNYGVRQGRSGSSVGKRALGIAIVAEATRQPVGVGKSVLRQVVHGIDSAAGCLGYLWPLLDDKRQTWTDKLFKTVAVPAPKR